MGLDATVRRSSEDGSQIIANVSGRVVIDQKQLSIREALLIHGDVNFETCDINSRVDVDVKGRVLDRFEVNSGGTITIGGRIMADFDTRDRHACFGDQRNNVRFESRQRK